MVGRRSSSVGERVGGSYQVAVRGYVHQFTDGVPNQLKHSNAVDTLQSLEFSVFVQHEVSKHCFKRLFTKMG